MPRLIVSLLLVAVASLCPFGRSLQVPDRASVSSPATATTARAFAAVEQAEMDGRDSDAEAGYRTLAVSADPALGAQADLGLGRFLERRGRSAEAIVPLQTASRLLGTSAAGLQAEFLLGEAESDQHQNVAAAAAFRAYRDAGGPAAAYAALEEAWAEQAAGDDRAALAALLPPLRSSSRVVHSAALSAAADSLARLGEPAAAAADEETRATLEATAAGRADALVQAGRMCEQAGDTPAAAAEYTKVISTYPSLPAAGVALDRLDALGVVVEPLQRGVVLFNLRRNGDAKAAFQAALAASPPANVAAEATYYLAALADRAGQTEAALAGYQAALEADGGGPLAAEVLWAQAQLLESLGRYAEAQAAYAGLAQRFPSSTHAHDGDFEAGMMAFLDGRPDDAAQLWAGPARSNDSTEAAEANLWLGKLALARGDQAGAAASLARAQALQPAGYYGLRAQALAAGSGSSSLAGPSLGAPAAPDWTSAERWLTAWAGPEDPSQARALQATEDWREAMALAALGWRATPTALLDEALEGAQDEPWVLYRAARTLQDAGLTTLALRTAESLLGRAPASKLVAPPALLRIAYPVPYLELVNQDAAQNGVDPLLIYAIVRQESAFEPSAGSGAGAQGLAQLLPATAQEVERSLGLAPLAAGDLARPDVNLRLGAAYLGQQARASAGDLSQTLAAYNAGGGNAARWARGAEHDPDLFYERVDFGETRSYIRIVTENYAIYSFLYRGRPSPAVSPP